MQQWHFTCLNVRHTSSFLSCLKCFGFGQEGRFLSRVGVFGWVGGGNVVCWDERWHSESRISRFNWASKILFAGFSFQKLIVKLYLDLKKNAFLHRGSIISFLNYLSGWGWNLNNFMTGAVLENLAEQGGKCLAPSQFPLFHLPTHSVRFWVFGGQMNSHPSKDKIGS